MLPLLINILILCIIVGVAWWVLTQIPLPEPFAWIVRIVVVVIACIALIYMLQGLAGSAGLRLR
jgi:nucleoside recognition membrane protein YjiH